MPIGIVKNDLSIATFNYSDNPVSLITAVDFYSEKSFLKAMINLFGKVSNENVVVIDAAKLFTSKEIEENYINSNFDSIVEKINSDYDKQKEVYEANDYNDEALKDFKKTTYFIFGISNFLSRINTNNKDKLCSAIASAKEYNVNNYVIVDSSDKLKSFAYDEWYKNSIDDTQGIWLGNGISDQYVFKLMSTPRELREEIPENFGYIVKNGKATLVKFVVDE